MTTKTISLKVWENNNLTLLANQGEVNSRYIEASFKNQSDSNISLSGKTVTFYALKPDGTKIFNNCEINTSSNTATVMLTSQMSATKGVLECEFQIFDSNNVLLKANGIKIIVSSKGDFSEAIESTSEFNALTSAINELDIRACRLDPRARAYRRGHVPHHEGDPVHRGAPQKGQGYLHRAAPTEKIRTPCLLDFSTFCARTAFASA